MFLPLRFGGGLINVLHELSFLAACALAIEGVVPWRYLGACRQHGISALPYQSQVSISLAFPLMHTFY